MKDICEIVCYDDRKVYDFVSVVDKFKDYFGVDIDEINDMFMGSYVLKWEDLCEKLQDYGLDDDEINNRKFTYSFYNKTLLNLRTKGMNFVDLIKYLNDGEVIKCDEKCENILSSANMFHFGSLLNGKSINKILVLMYHLLNNFDEALKTINLVDNYLDNNKLINLTIVTIDGETAYPSDSLIVYDDEYKDLLDKTSFIVNSNIKRKVKNKIGN